MNTCLMVLLAFLSKYEMSVCCTHTAKYGWFLRDESHMIFRTWVTADKVKTHLIVGDKQLIDNYGPPQKSCVYEGKNYGVWMLEKELLASEE